MDAIDRKILSLVQENASLSVAEISKQVGLSATPCWKRMQRLEADGVIKRRVALIDQDKLGLGVTVFVSIKTGDHSPAWLDRFSREVSAMPEVMEFYRMAGDVDYMLRVVVPDISAYDLFYKRLIATAPLQERDVALCHGKDQVYDSPADCISGEREQTSTGSADVVG